MTRALLPALLALLLSASPALAHKLKVFATAEGAVIAGYAYFGGEARAAQSRVTILAPDDAVVHQGETDDQGQFRYTAQRRMDHRIVVEGADGHHADFTVTAAELPDSLPGGPTPAKPAQAASAAASTADLQALIDEAVARQIRPLREQLDAYQTKVWWHDVVGGLGYITGLAGLAYGLSRRPRKDPP